MDYREALDWLYSTQMFGIKLGLENAHRLVAALDAYPIGKRLIHVAGTNGKGSVCAMAEAIARTAGYSTGLFTSPHLVRYNERIKINGNDVGDDEIADSLTHIRRLVADWETHPTFFEITTALGLLLFRKYDCQIIILETGMGGRLDATNIVTPSVSVLTKIDFDHAHWLGDTLEKIALEKAGIIKPNIPALTYPQSSEVLAVFQNASPQLILIDQPYTASPVALAGDHQLWNAALAISALRLSGLELREKWIVTGLENIHWPGRFQEILPGIFLDGAHNPAAAAMLVQTWKKHGPTGQATILLGILADKEIAPVVSALAPLAARWITVAPKSPRSLSPENLAEQIRLVSTAPVSIASSLIDAMETTPPPLLICGSLFLVGEALAYFQNETTVRPTAQ